MARLCPPGKLDRALDLLDRDEEAGLEELEALATKYAKDPRVRVALGTALVDAERPQDALAHLEWAERREPVPATQGILLDAYRELGMPLHAIRLAKRAGVPGPGPEEVAEVHGPRPDPPTAARIEFERARLAAMRRDPAAGATLARLVEAHPEWTQARNLLALVRFVEGDLGAYLDAAREAAERAPDDVRALLHGVRAALLEGGVEAARALRPRLDAAGPDGDDPGALLARAQALALMEDEEGVRAALDAFDAAVGEEEAEGDALRGALADVLERREIEPATPLVGLHELVPGAIDRWSDAAGARRAGAELARLPGLLRELPRRIGHAPVPVAWLLGGVLLSEHAPPAPEEPWPGTLERIVREGPGSFATRAVLLALLADAGAVPEGRVRPAGVASDALALHRLDLAADAAPEGLDDADASRLHDALHALAEDRREEARPLLEALAARHPDAPSVGYDLAIAERGPEGEATEASRARMEALVERHPDYVYARAQLAIDAIEADETDRAEALLVLPEPRPALPLAEWATFASAQGRLALAQGDADLAEAFLEGIEATVGEDASAYSMLADAIDEKLLGALSSVLDGAAEGGTRRGGADGDEARPGAASGGGSSAATEGDELDAILSELAEGEGAPAGLDPVAGLAGADDDPEGLGEDEAPPAPEALAALPARDESWFLAATPAAFLIGEGSEPELEPVWLTAIVVGDGFVRALHPLAAAPDAEAAYRLLAGACLGEEHEGPEGRPRRVTVENETLALDLADALRGSGIDVGVGDATPARAVIRATAEAVGSGAPAWLADAPPERAAAFLEATDAFYEAEPWTRFDGDRYLAFRVADGPWRYANVMGQEGEEYGLALFEGWRQLQAFVAGREATSPTEVEARLREAEGFESLSLDSVASVSPLDAARYLELGFEPYAEGEVAAFLRFGPEGLERPRHDPGTYAALLRVVAESAEDARDHRVARVDATVETPEGPLRVLYPATGGEAAETSGGPPAEA